jgi:hypothetical protein
VESRPYGANIGAASRPFILPRPDEELDSCFFNVDSHLDFWMQIKDWKNVVVDSVVFTGNTIHGLNLHDFALSTETGWQSDAVLTRSEWNLLPQHRAILPLEQEMENYMFLLIRLDRALPTPRVDAHCTNVSVSQQLRRVDPPWEFCSGNARIGYSSSGSMPGQCSVP